MNSLSQASMVTFGNTVGAVDISTPSRVAMTVSLLFGDRRVPAERLMFLDDAEGREIDPKIASRFFRAISWRKRSVLTWNSLERFMARFYLSERILTDSMTIGSTGTSW
jgi:hypothetical protein